MNVWQGHAGGMETCQGYLEFQGLKFEKKTIRCAWGLKGGIASKDPRLKGIWKDSGVDQPTVRKCSKVIVEGPTEIY